MYLNLNENQIQQSWSNHIKESLGVTDANKLNWMSKYAYFHSMNEKMLNESVDGHAHLNPNMTIGGMGDIRFPSQFTRAAYEPGLAGSGDKTFSTLPLGLQVAAQTIALDLLYVVPMSTPHGTMQYLDYVYEGGRIHPSDPFATSLATGKNTAAPYMIKLNAKFTVEASTEENEEATKAYKFFPNKNYYFTKDGDKITYYKLTFLYPDRVDGNPLFRVMESAYHSNGTPVLGGEGAELSIFELVRGLADGTYGFGEENGSSVEELTFDAFARGLEPVENVKALQNHIASYSGRGFLGDKPATDWRAYTRGLGEETPARQIGLKSFDIDYKADTIKVSAAITREQVQDLKVYGIDAVAQVEAKLADELTQTINKQILQKMFTLGAINAKQLEEVEGVNKTSAWFTDDSVATGTTDTMWLGFDRDGNEITTEVTSANVHMGGEVMGTIQRRIMSKILYASQVINVRGRLGQGNFAVVSGTVGTALQDIAGFMPYPMNNTISVNKSLYPIGSLSGIAIYVDPNMALGDMRILVGRKGKEGEPGLMFAPYLLAEKVETTSEFTFGPVMVMSSRYSIVEVGHNPQLQYVTLGIRLTGIDII